MRILFIGDVFGRPGRRILKEKLQSLIEEHSVDFCVANVENAAGGFGITPPIAESFLSWGIDLLTSGNHIWDKREIIPYLADQPRLLRPQNYPSSAPGTGTYVGETDGGVRLGVLNIQGRIFMPTLDCPFVVTDAVLERMRQQTKIILVDFHGEATSEKQAFGWYVDGRVSGVVGTHTHVQTADERILPKGTAYITDVGMTGPYDSVIGSVPETALVRFLRHMPSRLEPATGNSHLCGVLLEIEDTSGRAASITRINVSESN